LAGGKVLLAHRSIISQRSPELRDMVDAETPGGADGLVGSDQPIQILLPQLQVESAKALLHFLYTDLLPAYAATDVSLLQAISRVSVSLRIVSCC
jgi:hypothetical protein